jgi:hypothetical protein
VIRHWVSRDLSNRGRHLPQLLSLVSVAELPAGLPLSAHLPVTQLGTSPEARSALSTLSALVNRKGQTRGGNLVSHHHRPQQQQQQHSIGASGRSSNRDTSRDGEGHLLRPSAVAAAGGAAMQRARQHEQQQWQQWQQWQYQPGAGDPPVTPRDTPGNLNGGEGVTHHQQQQQQQEKQVPRRRDWKLGTENEQTTTKHHLQQQQQEQQQQKSSSDCFSDAFPAAAGDQAAVTVVPAESTAVLPGTTTAAAAVMGPGSGCTNNLMSCSSSADTLMLDATLPSSSSFSYSSDSPLWTNSSTGGVTVFTHPTTTSNNPIDSVDAGRGSGLGIGLQEGLLGGFGWVTAPRRRSHRPTRLLVAGGHDLSWRSLSYAEVLDPLDGAWAPVAGLPAAMSFAGAALLDRSVYVVEGAMFSSVVARYDPGADAWSSCPGLIVPRLHAAVAAAAGEEGRGWGRGLGMVVLILPRLHAARSEYGTTLKGLFLQLSNSIIYIVFVIHLFLNLKAVSALWMLFQPSA